MEPIKRSARFLTFIATPVAISLTGMTLRWNSKLVDVVRSAQSKLFLNASRLLGREIFLLSARNCKVVAGVIYIGSFTLPGRNLSSLQRMFSSDVFCIEPKDRSLTNPLLLRRKRDVLNQSYQNAKKYPIPGNKILVNNFADTLLERGKAYRVLGQKLYAANFTSHLLPMCLNILVSPYIGVSLAALASATLLGSYLYQQNIIYSNCSRPLNGVEQMKFSKEEVWPERP